MIVRGFGHDATGKLLVPAGMGWDRYDAHCIFYLPSPTLTPNGALPSVKAQLRNGTMIVTGDQWPIFLYQDERYDSDDPWAGLLMGRLVLYVCVASFGQGLPI